MGKEKDKSFPLYPLPPSLFIHSILQLVESRATATSDSLKAGRGATPWAPLPRDMLPATRGAHGVAPLQTSAQIFSKGLRHSRERPLNQESFGWEKDQVYYPSPVNVRVTPVNCETPHE